MNALALPACSLLPTGGPPDPSHATPGASATPAFAVELRAPDSVRELLERHLELLRFRHLSDLQANELQRLLGAVDANVRELLGTMGYFAPDITVESTEATEATASTETPGHQAAPRTVVISVQPGPQTRIASVDIAFADSAADANDAEGRSRQQRLRRDWSLAPGQPFSQSAWDDAKSAGLRQLQARRYPTARIVDSHAEIDADTQQAQLSVTYDTGPAYRFGPLRLVSRHRSDVVGCAQPSERSARRIAQPIPSVLASDATQRCGSRASTDRQMTDDATPEGSQRYEPDGMRRLARLPSGAVYDEAELLDAQLRLADSGYYDSVFLTLDTEGGDPQAAPVVAQLRETRLQKLVFGPGFSTDSGPRLSLEHIHNRVPGLGWRAVSKLSLDRQARRAGTEWTALPGDDGWRWFVGGQLQREATGDYDLDSGRLRSGRSKSTKNLDRNYFLQYDAARDHGGQGLFGQAPSGSTLSVNYGWTGRYFNSLTAPTRGHGVALELGLGSTLRPARDPFLRTLMRWQSFIPAGRVQDADGKGRNARLALRADVGAVLAGPGAQIPETQRFLTGGDTSVRGYGYRSIGAHNDGGQLHGGRYLAVGSVEWQRPIVYDGALSDWESTLFIDAGAVADRPGALRPLAGLGTGLRWRSPVGPLQTDLAYGLKTRKLRLHLRLGFNF